MFIIQYTPEDDHRTKKQYKIWFEKTTKLQAILRPGPDTMCVIEKDDVHYGGYQVKWIPMTRQISYIHPKDKYNNITGKKIALRKCLEAVFPGETHKSLRTKIWKGFWTWVESWETNNSKSKNPKSKNPKSKNPKSKNSKDKRLDPDKDPNFAPLTKATSTRTCPHCETNMAWMNLRRRFICQNPLCLYEDVE